jgi:hypothetical protein
MLAVMYAPKPDKTGLDRILAKQELVVSQSQVLPCGMTRKALGHRIRPGGPWQELLPRTYLAVTGSPTLTQKEIAVALYAGPQGVMTGFAALRRHGMKVPEDGSINVLIPASQASQSRRSLAFVRLRPTVRMPAPICYREWSSTSYRSGR